MRDAVDDQFQDDVIAVTTCTLDDPTVARPTKQYGVESMVAWGAAIVELPHVAPKRTFGIDVHANLIDYQHSDHDT
jgi:hypothetical protein